MAARGDVGRSAEGSDEPAGAREASWSLQAGLLAVALIGALFASLGPLFHVGLAYVLLAVAGVLGILGIRWADRALHLPPTRTSRRTRLETHAGGALSAVAFAVVLYFAGVWFLLFFMWPMPLVVGLIAWAIHRQRAQTRASYAEAAR